jgi:hypothetical protein
MRVPCVGETLIDVLDPNPQTGLPARVIDVGTSSVKLALPVFLCPGTLIRITVGDATADAEVRYCTCEGAEYYAGVRLDEITPKP